MQYVIQHVDPGDPAREVKTFTRLMGPKNSLVGSVTSESQHLWHIFRDKRSAIDTRAKIRTRYPYSGYLYRIVPLKDSGFNPDKATRDQLKLLFPKQSV